MVPFVPFVSLEAVNLHYNAEEQTQEIGILDEESGDLRGGTVALGARVQHWTLALGAELADGTLAYTGRSQPFLFPITTTTRLERRNGTVSFGYQWETGTDSTLAVNVEASRREFGRDIRPSPLTSALTETTRSSAAGVRIEWRQILLHRYGLGWSGHLLAEVPFRQTLEVDSHGVYDGFDERPGSRPYYGLALGPQLKVAENISVFAQFGYSLQRYAASPAVLIRKGGVPAGTASYPGSRQVMVSSQLGVNFSF